MAWKIRVKHAHGRMAVELAPRMRDHPLVVGRIPECDIEIPSTAVSRKHCLIFVYGDSWVVQDLGSRVGTFINGTKILEPTQLEAGDVITLGDEAKAPSLTMEYTESASAPETIPQANADPATSAAETDLPPSGPDAAMFDAGKLGLATNRYYVPHKNTWSWGIVATLVIVSIVLLGGGALMFRRLQESRKPLEKKPPVVRSPLQIVVSPLPVIEKPAQVATAPSLDGENPRANVFVDSPSPPVAAKPIAPEPPTPPAPADVPAPMVEAAPQPAPANPEAPEDAPVVSTDPRRNSEAWQRVEYAHRVSKPGEALYIYETYRIDNPTGPFLNEVNAFYDEAFDLLWWYRIKDLISQNETLHQQIGKLDDDIRFENTPAPKKELRDTRRGLAGQLLLGQTALQEMNYASPDAPDVYDPDKLAELRKTRDPKHYEAWKKKTIGVIKYTRGRRAF